MNQIDKKRYLWIIPIVILLGVGVMCFIKAYSNYKNNSETIYDSETNTESASEISSKYEDVDYGEVTSLDNTTISKGGSYDLSGEYGTITINTTDSVQLNLNNVSITSTNGPAINIVEADVVNIVLTGKNTIKSNTTEELDGAIYSKADLVFSGTGSLNIESNYDGIVSKDTLVFKSGTYNITSKDDGIRGKDNVAIIDGTFNITVSGDGIKSTNEEDSTKGYVAIDGGTFKINSVTDAIQAETNVVIKGGNFTLTTSGSSSLLSSKGIKASSLLSISNGTFVINTTDDGIHSNGDLVIDGGTFTITSKDDGIHADGMVTINSGTITISAGEGIEATYVKINDGVINISSSDDGINAGNKSTKYTVTIEINGGTITIKMGSGDTDGIDSNGNLYINGGTINITGNSPFDYDGEAKYTGGTIIVNGETTNSITNQMMGGGVFGGGRQGDMGRRMR